MYCLDVFDAIVPQESRSAQLSETDLGPSPGQDYVDAFSRTWWLVVLTEMLYWILSSREDIL